MKRLLLQSLLSGPKTFEDIELLIPPKLLHESSNAYVQSLNKNTRRKETTYFFLNQNETPTKETFTATEKKIYDVVTYEGISAGKSPRKQGFHEKNLQVLRRLRAKNWCS